MTRDSSLGFRSGYAIKRRWIANRVRGRRGLRMQISHVLAKFSSESVTASRSTSSENPSTHFREQLLDRFLIDPDRFQKSFWYFSILSFYVGQRFSCGHL